MSSSYTSKRNDKTRKAPFAVRWKCFKQAFAYLIFNVDPEMILKAEVQRAFRFKRDLSKSIVDMKAVIMEMEGHDLNDPATLRDAIDILCSLEELELKIKTNNKKQ
ncbi:hypothetical protein [Herbaspirillum sp. ST 5-3]|uniref:hypothetical protein n=1 Tax=Oxalobacteraceae TaxID=75682 RepID=UPI0010A3D3F2|nr:hypothetical protein [Herbaspirillum sp. ST 5-3]